MLIHCKACQCNLLSIAIMLLARIYCNILFQLYNYILRLIYLMFSGFNKEEFDHYMINYQPVPYFEQNNVNAFQIIIQKQELLNEQVAIMKQQILRLQQCCQELSREKEAQEEKHKVIRKEKLIKASKKIFRKNHSCSFQGCSHCYSSTIALNAHIKRVHYPHAQDSQQFAP